MAKKATNEDLTREVKAIAAAQRAEAEERNAAFREEWAERMERPVERPATAFPTSVLHRHSADCRKKCPVFNRPIGE